MAMRENVGRTDRILRTIVGPSLIALGAVELLRSRLLGTLSIVTGTLVLESAITRVCPVNSLLGIDTRSSTEKVRDFRADVNEQSDRISAEYGKPIGFDEAPAVAMPERA